MSDRGPDARRSGGVRCARPALLAVLGFVLPCVGAAAQGSESSPRLRHTINEGWRYVAGDPVGAEASAFDDAAWSAIVLPHTWNADDAFDESTDYRRGVGWYRKRLPLAASLRGRRIFLYFEGANQVATVYVNGREAGRHVGGYTAFAFDITELVSFDATNVVAVRVDNRHDDDIPPLNADFTFYGGIYRDVWLIATAPVHVTVLDHASPGIFIETPEASAARATVRIRGTLANATAGVRNARVVSRVLAADGAEVATVASAVRIPARGSARFAHEDAAIQQPLLWSPEQPYVYRVVTDVIDAGRLVDRVANPLGIRWLAYDANGFSLNGAPLRLIGTNRHQDRAGYGNALPDAAHREDVGLVKATGFNFLRLAHYPQDPAVLEAMDRLGLAGWEEIPVVNTITLSDAFADNAERMLVEMIRQHYNHPSILFWGYMNEVLLRQPDPLPADYRARLVELARRLDARAHAEDPGRPTVMAISLDEIDDGTGLQDVSDIIGFNLYFGWYYRTLDGLGAYLDSLHARHPNRPLMVSEYGAGSDERIHTVEPRPFDFSTEHQRRFHEVQLPQLLARDYLLATAVWNHFDFGSAGRHDSKPNINQKGLRYFDRRPKDVWHYYRAVLVDEPVVHIAARDWPRRAGSRAGDETQPIVVYTNAVRVELFANGVPLGVRTVENATTEWRVALRPGMNTLVARARFGDGTVEDRFEVVYEDRAPLLIGAASPLDPRGAPRASAPTHDAVRSVDAATSAPATSIAVNAGSHYHYFDAFGTTWEADHPYQPGAWGHVGGQPALIHHRIAATEEDALLQATRQGATAYRFDVPDGEYDVRLVFAETEHASAGARILDVRVNGLTVFDDLDLAAAYGRYVAVERTVRVRAEAGGGIVIALDAAAGATTVSGIEVRRR